MLPDQEWRWEAVLRLLLGLFACMVLGGIVLGLAFGHEEVADPGHSFVSFVVSTASFHGAGLLLIHLFLREHGSGWIQSFGFNRGGQGGAAALGLCIGIGILPVAWLLTRLCGEVMQAIGLEPTLQTSVQMLQSSRTMSERIYFGVAAVGLAPLVEELIFRGVLYPAIRQWGHPQVALWTTSTLFAVTHSNLLTFLPLLILGVVLTVLYERVGSLVAPIVAHSVFNLANFAWMLVEAILE